MKEYDFTLRFVLGHSHADPGACVDALMREGCDDALVGIGKPGHIALDFTREAASAEEAVISALAAVKRAIPDCRFIEAAPDFVGITDIANLLGFSRQNMRKVVEKSGTDFPCPVHGGNRPIWHLAPVLSRFATKQSRKIDTALLEISRVNRYCNYAKERGLLDRDLPEEVKRAVA
jgi:hypothetical protein